MQKEAYSSFIELRHQQKDKQRCIWFLVAGYCKESFYETSKMCIKYENVPHVEYEIQRRVLTRNVDKRPSTVNIYIYSGHVIHIEYILKLVKE